MKIKKLFTAFLLLGCLFSTSCNINIDIVVPSVNSGVNLDRYRELLIEFGIDALDDITVKEYLKDNVNNKLSNELYNSGYYKKVIVYKNNELVGALYEGSVLGYGGPIHFQLLFKGNVCHLFKCLSNSETPGFNLIYVIPNIINGKPISYFKEDTLDKDFLSGCTITETYLVPAICRAAHDYSNILNNENIPYEENKNISYEENLFGIENALYTKVKLGALKKDSNIKNVYIASVKYVETTIKCVETAICYELEGTYLWDTGHGNGNINGTLGVAFNISNNELLTANAINLGTGDKFKEDANTVLSSFVNLDASVISKMTVASHEGIDFIANSTKSSELVFNLVVEAANQYINVDKLVYSFGVSDNFEKVENVTLPTETNIKNIYLGKVNGLNNVLGYELVDEYSWDTGHGYVQFNSNVFVLFDVLTNKVLTVKVFNGGTGSKYNTSANTVAAQFVGLDVATVAEMTVTSHEGIDFVANSTYTSTNVFNLVVEAANHYVNNSSLKYGVNATFEELTTTLSANIKKAYVGKVESVNKAVAYELEKEVSWNTSHGYAKFTAKAIVVIDLETEKIISLSLSDCGTSDSFKNNALVAMATLLDKDVNDVAALTETDYVIGTDYVSNATKSGVAALNLVVEAANQYVNVDKYIIK